MAIHNQLIHATRTKSGPNGSHHNFTSIDIADDLGFTLRGVCTFPQQNDWSLLDDKGGKEDRQGWKIWKGDKAQLIQLTIILCVKRLNHVEVHVML